MSLRLDILSSRQNRVAKQMDDTGTKIHCTLRRRSDILKTLQASQAFVGVSEENLQTLIAQCDVYHYAHAQVIIHQGDPSLHLYILLCGALRIERHAFTIADINATPPSTDILVGEIGLLDHGPCVASVTASSLLGVECLVVPLATFNRFLAANPPFARALHKVVASRVRQNMLVMDELCASATARRGKTTSSPTTMVSDAASTIDGTTSAESSVKALPAATASMKSKGKKQASIFSRDTDTSDIMESLLGMDAFCENFGAPLVFNERHLSDLNRAAKKKEEQVATTKDEQVAAKEEQVATTKDEKVATKEEQVAAKEMVRRGKSDESCAITDGKKEDEGGDGEDGEIQMLPLWSFGARHHEVGACNPCGFYYKSGCNQGEMCKFCHMCNTKEKYKERKRERMQQLRKNKEVKSQEERQKYQHQQEVEHKQREDTDAQKWKTQKEKADEAEEADPPGPHHKQKTQPVKRVQLELMNKHHVEHSSFSYRYNTKRPLPPHLIHAAKMRAAYDFASWSSMYAHTPNHYAMSHLGSMIAPAHAYAPYLAATALHAQRTAAACVLGSSAPYFNWSSAGDSNLWEQQKLVLAEQQLPACNAEKP